MGKASSGESVFLVVQVAMKFLWKWLWCSWLHRKHRCYPTVWGAEQAKEMGIPYRPNEWHCHWCHTCGEGIGGPEEDRRQREWYRECCRKGIR